MITLKIINTYNYIPTHEFNLMYSFTLQLNGSSNPSYTLDVNIIQNYSEMCRCVFLCDVWFYRGLKINSKTA